MEEEVRDAVFGNVGTMITFRVGAFDAEVLEKEYAPTFEAADLVNLGFAQIYLKLMIDGVSSQPFSATTLGPIGKLDITFKDQVIASSREQFANPRAEVEKGIVDWHDSGTNRENRPPQGNEGGGQSYNNNGANKNDNRSYGNNTYQGSNNSGRQFQRETSRETPRDSFREAPRDVNRDVPRDMQREVTPESPKVDENKIAFMKAAEELKQKIKVEEVPFPVKNSIQKNFDQSKKPETVSLSALIKDKKNPTKENLTSLKDALANVISKPKQEEVKEIKKEHVETPKPKVFEKKEEPVVDKKVEEKTEPKKDDRVEYKKEEKMTHTKNEVPEDVLRQLLSMDDK